MEALVVPSVEAQIEALFPKGVRSAVLARWSTVKRQYGDGTNAAGVTRARAQMFQLVDWVIRQEPKLGVSALSAFTMTASVSPPVAQLISSMYAYVFPNAPLPPTALTGDAVVGVVMPGAPATIVTPAKLAGAAFPAGSVSEPMLLVINEKPGAAASYAAACSGPLPTTLCQYPLFYEFHPFPYQILLTRARAGVCVATSGPRAPSTAVKPRLRLAHQTPAPAAVIGTVYEGVEILPHAHVDDFLECDDVEFTPLPPVLSRVENPVARAGLQLLAQAGGSAWRAVSPRRLYAYDRGGGGEIMAFSDFDAVDTLPMTPAMPDLSIGSPFTFYRGVSGGNSDTLTIEYDTISVVSYTISNTGAAGAPASQRILAVGGDSTLSGNDAYLSLLSTPAIAQSASYLAPQQYVTIPSSFTHGVRWIGPFVDADEVIAETSESNNFVSRRTVLIYPNITFDSYVGGATACSSCNLDSQYAARATTFSFVPTGGSPEPAWLRQTDWSYPGNREATAPQSPIFTAVVPKNGDFFMHFAAGVRSVSFKVRVPVASTQPPITAEDNATGSITPSITMVTTTTDRIYTVTVSSTVGVNHVRMSVAGSSFPYVDNVIVRP